MPSLVPRNHRVKSFVLAVALAAAAWPAHAVRAQESQAGSDSNDEENKFAGRAVELMDEGAKQTENLIDAIGGLLSGGGSSGNDGPGTRVMVRVTDSKGRPMDGLVTLRRDDGLTYARSTVAALLTFLNVPVGEYDISLDPVRERAPASKHVTVRSHRSMMISFRSLPSDPSETDDEATMRRPPTLGSGAGISPQPQTGARVMVSVEDSAGRPMDGRVVLRSTEGQAYAARTVASRCTLIVPAGEYYASLQPFRERSPRGRPMSIPNENQSYRLLMQSLPEASSDPGTTTQKHALKVMVRNTSSESLRIWMRGVADAQEHVDVIPPGKARIYTVNSADEYVYFFYGPQGGAFAEAKPRELYHGRYYVVPGPREVHLAGDVPPEFLR